tara:strand:- start:1635 stop:2930 length:1296 start_codon:yes stop_codon:yes gene_type:complete
LDTFKNLRGTFDLLPPQLIKWQNVERIIKQQLFRSSIKEIRTPIIELTDLFIRGIGEGTDVVNKEMYTFIDRGERSCTLRPEGTASVARAYINSGNLLGSPHKFWYMGPMFRYERPQAGRQRQFHQLGVEFLGYQSPRSDVEIISLAWDILQELGVSSLNLEINSLGDVKDRLEFQKSFVYWLKKNSQYLDDDSKLRIDKNPLRILDTKIPQTQEILQEAPKLIDFLSEDSIKRYDFIKTQLDDLKIPFKENPKLVRGLDYYTHTAFEITSDLLGTQATVCGGGRYDNLIEQMGGSKTPAIGFAMGLERLMLLVGKDCEVYRYTDIYIVNKGELAESLALEISRKLHRFDIITELDVSGSSFSKQFKKANKLRSKSIILIGDDEASKREISIRLFEENNINNQEETISIDDNDKLERWINKNLNFKQIRGI